MDALIEIQNWLKEFKENYKPIFICTPPKDYRNPEEYLNELKEISWINGKTKEGCVTLSITVGSLEEFGFLVRYLREKPGIKMIYDNDEKYGYPVDRFDPERKMRTYKTKGDFYNDQDYNCLHGTELYLEIDEAVFIEFWKNFWKEFIIPCKYVLESS